MKIFNKHETFLVEYYGNNRSAALFVGTGYYMMYFYQHDELAAQHMFEGYSRAEVEPIAKQWTDMELMNEDQINKLYETFPRTRIRGII